MVPLRSGVLQSIVISIPRTRSSPDDLDVRAVWFANQLATEQVIAKVGYSISPRRGRFEVAGVLAFHHPSWNVLTSAPCRRALGASGLSGRGLKAEIAPAPLGADAAYCGARVRADLVLMCDTLTGMPPLRLAEGGGYVASHRIKLAGRTLADLWYWDEEYRSVYTLWLRSGTYESWACDELSRPDSDLNRMGRSLGRKIARETGLRVRVPVDDYAQ